MKNWFNFNGIAVFDHEEKKFWNKKDIKELANEFWKDAEFKRKPSSNDLTWIFKEEFFAYCGDFDDEITFTIPRNQMFWDDTNRWEMIQLPEHQGFGIVFGQKTRLKELITEMKGDKQ